MADSLGRRLKALRAESKMTLQQLGERAGLSAASLSRYENGLDTNPSLETLLKLAASLGVEPSVFLPKEPWVLPVGGPRKVAPIQDEGLEEFERERRAAGKAVDKDLLDLLRGLGASKGGARGGRPKQVWEWLYRALEVGWRMKQ